MTVKRYRWVLIETDGKAWWPTKKQVNHLIAEMERYGPNRGWVLAKALARARAGSES